MPDKSPKVRKELNTAAKTPSAIQQPNYKSMHPVWQLGIMDMDGKWGYESYSDKVRYRMSDKTLSIADLPNADIIFQLLDNLQGEYDNYTRLFRKLGENRSIPIGCYAQVIEDTKRFFFIEKLYPKLRDYEKLTWDEIEKQTYGKENKSKNHPIAKAKLSKDARERLEQLNQGDVDELFSLRLEGELRVFGIRELNCLKILWVDINHEVCESHKKHT